MKRITLLLIIGLALILVACGGEAQTASTAGNWEGSIETAGISTPTAFTVDGRGEVKDSSFDLRYGDQNLSYSVTSRTTSDTLTINAQADSALGSLTFNLTGTVQNDTMSGNYTLTITASDGSTAELNGSFTATRR